MRPLLAVARSSRSRCLDRARGFTLVELLVALLILALLSVMGYRAVASLTDSEVRLSAEAARWRSLEALFARLEADLRQAQPRAVRRGNDVVPAWLGSVDLDGNAVLEFSRAGPEFSLEAGSAGQRLGYRLRNGTVEVLYWPYLDAAPQTAATAYALADGIARLTLAYFDRSGAWRERWPVAADAPLPRAVRVEVVLTQGERVERWLVLQ
jgi:general secretion pathway protein J